jgi:hypothetical protein
VLKEILQDLKQQNKAIIFSTHQMETAEKLCDEICLIDHGTIVVEGTLKNVKKQFGQNSLHLEYNGDGSFLRSLPQVKTAVVYENYAELLLNENAASKDIIPLLTERLDLRKFEFVEPSLNSIFLHVVGADETIKNSEKPVTAPQPRAAAASVSADPRVKKALLSLIVGVLVGLTFIVVTVMKPNPTWTTPALMGALVLYSVFRYRKTVQDVKSEFTMRSEQEAGRAQ